MNVRVKFYGSLLSVVLLATVSAGSRADDADPLNIFVGQGVTFNSNLFRLPDGVSPSTAATGVTDPPRSETLFNTYAGMGFDKSYSLQHLHTDFTFTHYGYRTYKYLAFNRVAGHAAWDWAIGNRWNGTLSYDRTQTPSNDATQTGFQNAYQLYRRLAGDANYWWHPDWSVGAGLAKVNSNYSNSVNAFSDYQADVADARITYRPRSGNQIRLLVRRTDGNYSNSVLSPTSSLPVHVRDQRRRCTNSNAPATAIHDFRGGEESPVARAGSPTAESFLRTILFIYPISTLLPSVESLQHVDRSAVLVHQMQGAFAVSLCASSSYSTASPLDSSLTVFSSLSLASVDSDRGWRSLTRRCAGAR